MDALSLCRDIVDVYYRLPGKTLLSITLFTGNRSLHHPANNLKFDGINRWIAKGAQQRCSLPVYKGTLVCYSKNSNVGLHAECFELYQCK